MINLLNGTVRIRNRKIPINWTGEYAQHLAQRHLEDDQTHPFLHLDAQQILQKAQLIKKGNHYEGWYDSPVWGYIKLPILKFTNFVCIKTCFVVQNPQVLNKNSNKLKGLQFSKDEKNPLVTQVIFTPETIETIESEGESVEETEISFIKWVNSTPKVRRGLWKKMNANS